MTLGWIESRQMYKNVYSQDNGQLLVKYENHPITETGDSILQNQNHGQLTEYEDGFVVNGINKNQKLECPKGYGTSNCILKPICEPNDLGQVKTIDQSYFRLLNLYNYKESFVSSINTQSFHQKLRAKCLNSNGDYKIISCQDNEIVKITNDNSSFCSKYDICQEKTKQLCTQLSN